MDSRPRVDGKVIAPVKPACTDIAAWRGLSKWSNRLFRYENEDKNSFLLHPILRDSGADTPVKTVYRYDTSRDEITAVEGEVWLRASGEILKTSFKHAPAQESGLQFDMVHHTVRTAGGRGFSTAGRNVLAVLESPSGRYVSIVSTTGEARGWSPLGSSPPSGPHYQQFFTLPDAKPFGSVVHLPQSIATWWTPDERFLISSTCVIPVNGAER